MIKHPNDNWTINKGTECLLFFAQRLSEMLFDFTIDTYKAPALNTLLLCIEARNSINYIENESIDEKNLEHIVEELNWAFTSDLVAKTILNETGNLYFPLNNINDKTDLKLKLEILINKLEPKNYIATIKKLLSDAIKNNYKKDVNFLVTNLVTSLTSFAYHPNYIYKKTQAFFFGKNKIESVDKIDEFLSIFDLDEKTFDITFIASSLFKEIQETCEKFGVSISNSIDSKIKEKPNWKNLRGKFIKGRKDCFITVKEENSFDLFSARKDAGQRLRKIANLFTYFHHKDRPNWREIALVSDNQSDELTLISNPTSPMKKGFDLKPYKAAKKLNKFIDEFVSNFGHSKSFVLFNRANDLHGLAVADSSVENQLLNVWIAIETIIQSTKNTSKVEHISESLLPSLTINYTEKLLKDLTESLIRWNEGLIRRLFDEIPKEVGEKDLEKVSAIVACKEFKEIRKNLYAELDDFPLLRFRVCQLNQQIHSANKVQKLIAVHKMKVEWHIRRIYRTRNLIVHEGTISPNIEILVENAHTYLDVFLDKIIELAEKGSIKTIEQGIKETTLISKKYEQMLSENKNEECTKDNFQKFLFN